MRWHSLCALTFSIGATVDDVRRMEDLGTTDMVVAMRNPYVSDAPATVAPTIDALRRFADEVIAKV